MKTIIIYGDKRDLQIKNTLIPLLSKDFGINIVDGRVIKSTQGYRTINIIETANANEINVKNAILILKNNAKISSIKLVEKSTNIIVNSNNAKVLARLAKSLNHVYTCGFSSKDYMTFSSREQDSAVVSLQRDIVKLNGEICEPLDIRCKTRGEMNDYTILASSLCLILLNLINEKEPTILL